MQFFLSQARLVRYPAAMVALILASAGIHLHVSAQTNDATSIPVLPQTASDWKKSAIDDINAGYQITLDNHPGSYDAHNRDFLKNLKLAKAHGLSLAAKVTNAAGYEAAVQGFNVLIHDGHAGMATDLEPGLVNAERWPGFVTVWRGDALYVYASETGGPEVGAKVVACDGKPIRDLIKSNVFAFQGKVDEPGHWWVYARKVFVDSGNPFIALPKLCQFSAAGKKFEQELTWTLSTAQAKKWREESYNGDQLAVGMTEPRAKLFWVAMPTFQPDETQRDAYRVTQKEVEEHRQRYLDADAVVIDLRHNQGGSSEWSYSFASALWGKGRVGRRMDSYNSRTQIWWRASRGNTDFVAGLVGRLTKEKQLDGAAWAKTQSEGMQAALARGDKFFVTENSVTAKLPKGVNADLPTDPPAFTKPVYVVVPGQCASACLDALDVFTRFSNTKLIGAPSAADSTYMDVRTQRLDSGLAVVIIPNKVYVNRPRANGQGYSPSIFVNDLFWSTTNLLAAVEKDLAKKRSQK